MRPKAIMLTIHGGGWFIVGPAAAAMERPEADRWRAAGWLTLNISYRGCADSIDDVFWFYQHVRAMVDPAYTVCASGASAGAHLATLLAATFPDLGCAIGQGVPTDLLSVATETAYDPARRTDDQTAGPALVAGWAEAAFGPAPLPLVLASPILYASNVRARLLLADAHDDPLLPFKQATDLAAAIRAAHPASYVDTEQLASGPIWFVHAGVSPDAMTSYRAREDALVEPLLPAAVIDAPGLSFLPLGAILTGSASDRAAAVASVAVTFSPTFGGTPITMPADCSGCGTSSVTWSVATTGLPPGSYEATAAATSAAGNVGYSAVPGARVVLL
jgi:acetyl esterase/lipase